MIAREITRDKYAAFVASNSASLVFHHPDWVEAVARCYRVAAFYLGIFAGEQLAGALPVYRRRMFFFSLYGSPLRRTGTPPAVPVLAPRESVAEVFTALENWCRTKGVSHFQMTWRGPLPSRHSRHLRVETLDNLEIDLSSSSGENWKNLSELARRMVRRAIRSQVRLHWGRGAMFVERYQGLLLSTYGRQGLRPNFPVAMYRELGATLPGGLLRVLFASMKGRVIAAVWLLCGRDRCHYWDAASSEEGKELATGHLLVWEIIRWAVRNGHNKVDMVGTSVGGRGGSRPGIGRFKQSFGAVPVQYHIVYWQTPGMRLAMRAYRLLSSLHRRLLSVLAVRVGEKARHAR